MYILQLQEQNGQKPFMKKVTAKMFDKTSRPNAITLFL